MERSETHDDDNSDNVHVIDITTDPALQPSNETNGRQKCLENSGYLRSFQFVLTMSQIIAAMVFFYISKHEHPRASLLACLICYVSGCVANLALLFWRFYNRNETSNTHSVYRIKLLEIWLELFFMGWSVFVGVLVYGVRSPGSGAPNLYRLLSVFAVCLTFQYSMSLCLPCIIPLLSKKATSTTEPIIPVTTFKINIKKLEYRNDEEPHECTTEGGVVSTVTENA
ncbi:uncharacterized protein LOC111917481 [Lactuca sativa]|uniref:uncharacterized protein LOC111917481 n=1 Tax=Lactuca sativa TaxID=4236 RepID=UPI000CC14FCD|nr:uncharacterized protein LOC111917481 [Lactuca sativa]